MGTPYLVAWYAMALLLSVAVWFLARKVRSMAGRGLLRTGVPAFGLAALPSTTDGWVPAALYFLVGRDFMESIGISLIIIGVIWSGLFAAYWLVLVYRDALFGNGGRGN
ncbi:MAG: hypothetical protein V3T39_02760 [Gammaproteobacteria bacterium]